MIDYATIEEEALDVVRLKVPRVTNWVRGWTNEARKQIQRNSNYSWMAGFYPEEFNAQDATVDPAWAPLAGPWRAIAGQRLISAPPRFKEIYSERDGLYRVDSSGELVSLPARLFENIARTTKKHRRYDAEQNAYVLDEDTGPVECFVLARDSDGIAFRLYPTPAADTDLMLHGYFYLPDIPDRLPAENPAVGFVDAIIREFDPLVIRDALCREAFIALQQYDTAAKHEALRSGRFDKAARGERQRELPDDTTLRYSFNAKHEEPWPDDGYRRNRGPFR